MGERVEDLLEEIRAKANGGIPDAWVAEIRSELEAGERSQYDLLLQVNKLEKKLNDASFHLQYTQRAKGDLERKLAAVTRERDEARRWARYMFCQLRESVYWRNSWKEIALSLRAEFLYNLHPK
jgi:hypothetical protein